MTQNRTSNSQALERANNTIRDTIKTFFSRDARTVPGNAIQQVSYQRPRMDKFLPFGFFLDLSTKTVEFVIDEDNRFIRDRDYLDRVDSVRSFYQDRSPTILTRVQDTLSDFLYDVEGKLVVNGDDEISKLFGFESNRNRKLTFYKDREKHRRYKEFIQNNFIRSSTKLKWFQDEAEYANYMMVYIASSPLWDSNEFSDYRHEFNMASKFVGLIRDFCQLDHMKEKVKTWEKSPVIDSYTNREQKKRIEEVKKSINDTYDIRLKYLFVVEQVFFKFKDMEAQWENFEDIKNFEADLSVMEDRLMDLTARKEALVFELQELGVAGQAFDTVNDNIRGTLDGLSALDSPMRDDEIKMIDL